MSRSPILLLCFACGQVRPEAPADRPPFEPPLVDARPMERGAVEPIASFDVAGFGGPATCPVIAAGPDGRKHHASVDALDNWPMIGSGEGEMRALPGEMGMSTSLALVASRDGWLHAAWDVDDAIVYAMLDPLTYTGRVIRVAEAPADEPNIAIGPDGTVVVAYRVPADLDVGEPPKIMIRRGGPGGFSPPEHVNPGCCLGQLGDPADRTSGASLAVDGRGKVHVVYEWMTWDSTVIDYINDEGGAFGPPMTIAAVAYAPCPAIAVDERGVHITYLIEGNSDVWHRTFRDGALSDPVSLYNTDAFIHMAMMTMDRSGVMHLAVEVLRGEKTELVYVRSGEPERPIPIGEGPEQSVLLPTPRAGGALITPDGHLFFAFRRSESRLEQSGAAEVAYGLPVR